MTALAGNGNTLYDGVILSSSEGYYVGTMTAITSNNFPLSGLGTVGFLMSYDPTYSCLTLDYSPTAYSYSASSSGWGSLSGVMTISQDTSPEYSMTWLSGIYAYYYWVGGGPFTNWCTYVVSDS
jgi:hypothetical protein